MGAQIFLENEQRHFEDEVGQFEIAQNGETRYSPECRHMIETINFIPRAQLKVYWRAPTEPGTGCILIRATVLQHRDVAGLTKRICEEIADEMENHPQSSSIGQDICCACDEARYEVKISSLCLYIPLCSSLIY